MVAMMPFADVDPRHARKAHEHKDVRSIARSRPWPVANGRGRRRLVRSASSAANGWTNPLDSGQHQLNNDPAINLVTRLPLSAWTMPSGRVPIKRGLHEVGLGFQEERHQNRPDGRPPRRHDIDFKEHAKTRVNPLSALTTKPRPRQHDHVRGGACERSRNSPGLASRNSPRGPLLQVSQP
jgi:hypothetical protein